jgi:hypothetical protein
MRRPLPPRRRAVAAAFTITELLIVLSLYALISLAGGRLFNAAIRTGSGTAGAQNAAATTESALTVLRADAWSAAEIAPAGASVTLRPGGGGTSTITWTSAGATLTRHVPGTPDRQWPIGTGVTFSVDGPSLVLHLAASKRVQASDVRLVSELRLLSGVKP